MRSVFKIFLMGMAFLCGSHVFASSPQMPPEPPFLTEIRTQYNGFKTALRNKRFTAAQARLNNLEAYKSSNLPAGAGASVQNIIPADEFTAIIGKPTAEDFFKRSSDFVAKVKEGSVTLPPKLEAMSTPQPGAGAPQSPARPQTPMRPASPSQALPHIEPQLKEISYKELNPSHTFYNPDFNTGNRVLTEQTEAATKEIDRAQHAQPREKAQMFERAWLRHIKSISDMNQFMGKDNISWNEKWQLLNIIVEAIDNFKKALVAAGFSAQVPENAQNVIEAMQGKIQGLLRMVEDSSDFGPSQLKRIQKMQQASTPKGPGIPPTSLTQAPGGAPIETSAAEEKVQGAAQVGNEEIQKKAADGFNIYAPEYFTKKPFIDLLEEKSPYFDLAVVIENGVYYYFSPEQLANYFTQKGESINPITNKDIGPGNLLMFPFNYDASPKFPFKLAGRVTPDGLEELNFKNWVASYKTNGKLVEQRRSKKVKERTARITQEFIKKNLLNSDEVLSLQTFAELIENAKKDGNKFYMAVIPEVRQDPITKKNAVVVGKFHYFDAYSLAQAFVRKIEDPINRQFPRRLYIFKYTPEAEKENPQFPFIPVGQNLPEHYQGFIQTFSKRQPLQGEGAPELQPFHVGGPEQWAVAPIPQ